MAPFKEILLPRGSLLHVVHVQPRNGSDVASIVTADAVLVKKSARAKQRAPVVSKYHDTIL